jgi:hypothetical protein
MVSPDITPNTREAIRLASLQRLTVPVVLAAFGFSPANRLQRGTKMALWHFGS